MLPVVPPAARLALSLWIQGGGQLGSELWSLLSWTLWFLLLLVTALPLAVSFSASLQSHVWTIPLLSSSLNLLYLSFHLAFSLEHPTISVG